MLFNGNFIFFHFFFNFPCYSIRILYFFNFPYYLMGTRGSEALVGGGQTYVWMDGRRYRRTDVCIDGRMCGNSPMSYRTLALWGRCPALTPLLQLSLQEGHRVPLTMCNPWMTCWAYCHSPNALVTFSSTAPANPHAIRVAVYPALLISFS